MGIFSTDVDPRGHSPETEGPELLKPWRSLWLVIWASYSNETVLISIVRCIRSFRKCHLFALQIDLWKRSTWYGKQPRERASWTPCARPFGQNSCWTTLCSMEARLGGSLRRRKEARCRREGSWGSKEGNVVSVGDTLTFKVYLVEYRCYRTSWKARKRAVFLPNLYFNW